MSKTVILKPIKINLNFKYTLKCVYLEKLVSIKTLLSLSFCLVYAYTNLKYLTLFIGSKIISTLLLYFLLHLMKNKQQALKLDVFSNLEVLLRYQHLHKTFL